MRFHLHFSDWQGFHANQTVSKPLKMPTVDFYSLLFHLNQGTRLRQTLFRAIAGGLEWRHASRALEESIGWGCSASTQSRENQTESLKIRLGRAVYAVYRLLLPLGPPSNSMCGVRLRGSECHDWGFLSQRHHGRRARPRDHGPIDGERAGEDTRRLRRPLPSHGQGEVKSE